MSIRFLLGAALLVGLAAPTAVRSQVASVPAPASPRLATMADLQAMHDAGAYQICLQQIGRLIQLRDDLAKGYDRNALYLLRGDCLLHLQDSDEAARAYRAVLASPVPAQAQEGRATLELIARSRNLAYLPKGRGGEPLSITTEASRKLAMAALFEDDLAEQSAAIKAAQTSDTLLPIIDLAGQLLTLQALEVTATGKDEKIGPLLTDLGEHTRNLISRDLKTRQDQISAIEAKANQLVNNSGAFWWQNEVSRRGLYTPDRKDLRDLVAYVQKVESVAKMGQQFAWKIGRKGEKWEPILSDCYALIQHAERVLDAG